MGQVYKTSLVYGDGADTGTFSTDDSLIALNDPTGWHEYGIEWTDFSVTWYLDGK